ncbi:unnamed protein product, partial [Staurois parvus]
MYVKWFDTVMFYYVIFLKYLNFLPVLALYVLTLAGTGNWKMDAGIGREEMAGDTAGGH